MDKNQAFDYMISLFKKWHFDVTGDVNGYSDVFTKLSLLKLLFLTAATKNDKDQDLLGVFNNFYALPYGPVESDVFDSIKANCLPNFTLTDRRLIDKDVSNYTNDLSDDDIILINSSVEKLKSINKNLITLSSFELVEITHKWESWDNAYKFAKFLGKQSYVMPIEAIQNDRNKYYGN